MLELLLVCPGLDITGAAGTKDIPGLGMVKVGFKPSPELGIVGQL